MIMMKHLGKVKAVGPTNAKLMVVGEAPNAQDVEAGRPFSGGSGQFLQKLFLRSGLNLNDCYITNACKYRPPENKIENFFGNKTESKKFGLRETHGMYYNDFIHEGYLELIAEVNAIQPQVILALGNTALWMLTGEWGITNWRGSELATIAPFRRPDGRPIKVIPSLHPANVLRSYEQHIYLEHDIKTRLVPLNPNFTDPGYNFIVRPSYAEADEYLDMIIHEKLQKKTHISSDIETRLSHISCAGLGLSTTEAICIPFLQEEAPYNYWSYNQQVQLTDKLRTIHTHPNALISGQNFDYDRQYMARYWGIKSNLWFDTMTAHHLLWPGTLKGLDVLSSLYCAYHKYWKEESKDWDGHNEEQLWIYNCKDCVVTWEVAEVLHKDIIDSNMTEQYAFQLSVQDATFYSLLRGINYDVQLRDKFAAQLINLRMEKENELLTLNKIRSYAKTKNGANWWDSPTQTAHFFYNIMKVQKVLHKKTKKPTTDAKALEIIAKREPLLKDVCRLLEELRSIGQFYSNYILAKLDFDERIRCQLKVTGTETFRFASTVDAFGFGTNLQNIPSGK